MAHLHTHALACITTVACPFGRVSMCSVAVTIPNSLGGSSCTSGMAVAFPLVEAFRG